MTGTDDVAGLALSARRKVETFGPVVIEDAVEENQVDPSRLECGQGIGLAGRADDDRAEVVSRNRGEIAAWSMLH